MESKKLLLSSKVLTHFNPCLELRLACNMSAYGVGTLLSQVLLDGTERPVGFASRTLSKAERNYSQIKKEAFACVFGIKRFHSCLYGCHFTLQTDHKTLAGTFRHFSTQHGPSRHRDQAASSDGACFCPPTSTPLRVEQHTNLQMQMLSADFRHLKYQQPLHLLLKSSS